MKKDTIWNRNFTLLLLANICVSTSFHMISTTFTKYCIGIGSTEALAGMIVGVFSIASLCIRPFCGRIIDTRDKKKVYMLSVSALILVMALYGLTTNFTMLGILRFAHGFAFGFGTTTGLAMVSDVAPKGKVGSCIGMYGIASSVATALAPNLGIAIADAMSFRVMFFVAAGITVAALIFSSFVDRIPVKQSAATGKPGITLDQIFSKKALIIALMLLILGIANSSVSSFLSVYCEELQIANYATYFTVAAITMIVTRPTAGRLMDKYGINSIIWPAAASMTAAFFLFSRINSLPMLWLAGVLFGFGYGSLQPSLQALAFTRETPDRRGVTSSTVSVGVDIGNGVGATVAGVLAGAFGYQKMYLAAISFVVLLLAVYLLDRHMQKQTAEDATSSAVNR